MKLCMGCMNQIEDHISTCPYCHYNEMTATKESYYLSPGTIVGGKYIVGKEMSYGGHTVSYIGFDAEYNRKVVIKEYLPSDFSTRSEGEKDVTIYSGDAQEQFEKGLTNYLNEANKLEQLGKVESIAQVYDCLVENETGYVISEYVEGRTLKAILDSGKKYQYTEAVAFIKKILNGLKKVHPLDIIHCDISPETIMVTNNGEIKLMDFGATRYVTTANSKSLAIILTQGYAPEEQYRSKGVRGPWTDVYATAAVLYRMITGIVPQESVERALVDELQDPSKLGVNIPINIENALMNALNVYQENRTKSAADFLRELNSKDTKRIKVKKNNKAVAKFPLWAKGLVACLVVLIAVGGTLIYRSLSQKVETTVNTCTVTDLSGKTIEEAEDIVETWHSKYPNITITIQQSNTVYSNDPENNGKICDQNVPSGTDLLDSIAVGDLENDSFQYDKDNNLTGTISCTVYSAETIHYSEIREMNAYELAQLLGKDINKETDFFVRVTKEPKSKKDVDYWQLKNILLKDNSVVKNSDLTNEDKSATTINISDIKNISYYGISFFYWEELPDFADKYGTQKALKKATFKKYIYSNEKKKKALEKEYPLSSNMLDNSYCSYDYAKGTIVGQTVKAGNEYDASQDGNLKINIIGTKLNYFKTSSGDTTGAAIKKELKKIAGLKDSQIQLDGDASQYVEKYTCRDKNTGEVLKYFKYGDTNVKITLTLHKPVEVQETKPEASKKKSSSSSKKKKSSEGGPDGNMGEY